MLNEKPNITPEFIKKPDDKIVDAPAWFKEVFPNLETNLTQELAAELDSYWKEEEQKLRKRYDELLQEYGRYGHREPSESYNQELLKQGVTTEIIKREFLNEYLNNFYLTVSRIAARKAVEPVLRLWDNMGEDDRWAAESARKRYLNLDSPAYGGSDPIFSEKTKGKTRGELGEEIKEVIAKVGDTLEGVEEIMQKYYDGEWDEENNQVKVTKKMVLERLFPVLLELRKMGYNRYELVD